MYLEATRTVLNQICQIAASHLRADVACILTAEKDGAQIIRGTFGCLVSRTNGPSSLPDLLLDERDTVHLAGLNKKSWFTHHALGRIAPGSKSLLAMSFGNGANYLAVFNPNDGILRRPETVSLLSGLVSLADIQIRSERDAHGPVEIGSAPKAIPEVHHLEAREDSGGFDETDAMITFLDKTLVPRKFLGVRDSVAYFAIRSWRAQTKDVQIAAMRKVKSSPSSTAVKLISEEISALALEMNGPNAFDAIVPIPCGSSGTDMCLSARIAMEVAKQLNVPFFRALTGKLSSGSSHPKKSAALEQYTVQQPVPKRVLLVDDVITTGTHVSMGSKALRQAGANVTAIAWIGPSKPSK